jgi:diaminobutyrate-2-oxoglutarate transaminase
MTINFADLSFKAPKIATEIPGPKSKSIIEQDMMIDSNCVTYPRTLPISLEEGKGATVRDVDGNIYIDFFSGIGVLNFGHSNPYILKCVKEQQDKLIHCLDFPTPVRLKLLQKLSEVAPAGLKDNCKILFTSPTGADAVTAAIRLSKIVTKRNTILSFWGGYHGSVGEAGAVTSWTGPFKCKNLPMLPDVHFVPFPYCYRCPFKKSYPGCALECFNFLRDVLENGFSGACEPAAIILEPIQGEGGIHIPPLEFMEELRRITAEKGILLICDEVQTGMGRTGKMWAIEHFGVTPDIMTCAKSLGGIGIPLAAVFYKKEFDIWPPGTIIGTFRGNVLGMAASLGALNFIEESNLLTHVQEMSKVLHSGLARLGEKYEVIGDIRQQGLFAAVEFVKDRKLKTPWKEFLDAVLTECMKRGLLLWKAGHYFNVIRMLPPLIITEDLIQKSLGILDEVIGNLIKTQTKK